MEMFQFFDLTEKRDDMAITVTEQDVRDAIEQDPDFIAIPRFGCSLAKFSARYPDGAPSTLMIAKALACSEDDVAEMYAEALTKLREALG